ncbi:fucose permease [Okibacterium sp. HSC-33S16]|uniref:MFS transporter n=1 Tax=Okibacterium sp. HSC-33S16 TaxID=2910965 RepID=UPI00209D38B4|nr:MFS transporter [Okibacterium sp. HSC-33S16]MCP2031348.1 fucose permease [Okibacterium sp. HSC-33S16]
MSIRVEDSAVRPALSPELRRRRAAIFLFMLTVGVGLSSFIVRTPAVRDLVHASTAEMGLILFGLSVGSMTGILSSAALVRRFGARRPILIGGTAFVTGLTLLASMAGLGQGVGVFVGLVGIGLGFGLAEIAINIEGAAIEVASGRSILPVLHGCYSLGSVIGAVAGIGLTAVAFPVWIHLLVVAALALIALLWAIPKIPTTTGRQDAHSSAPPGLRAQLAVWKQHRVIMLGLIVLALALAEGAAGDWLPLLMVDGHGATPAVGSIVFAAFALAMTIGRFSGEPLIERFGKPTVLRASALVSAAGIALVIFSDNIVIAGLAVVLWGLGAALGFPLTLSAAGESDDPTTTVGAVASAGYVAFLVGPPLLGFLGEQFGLRGAMIVVLIVVAAAAIPTSAARTPAAPAIKE